MQLKEREDELKRQEEQKQRELNQGDGKHVIVNKP